MVLARSAAGRCDCGGFAVRHERGRGWLWWRSLCCGRVCGVQMAMDANGNDWNVKAVTALARTQRSVILRLQGSERRLVNSPRLQSAIAESVQPQDHAQHSPSTTARTATPTNLSLILIYHSYPAFPSHQSQPLRASAASTTTSFACDSPAKSVTKREVSYLCSSFTRSEHPNKRRSS